MLVPPRTPIIHNIPNCLKYSEHYDPPSKQVTSLCPFPKQFSNPKNSKNAHLPQSPPITTKITRTRKSCNFLLLNLLKCISAIMAQDAIYNIRQMGQQQTRPESPHKYNKSNHNPTPASSRKTAPNHPKPKKPVQCQGLLKLRTTPFKNSIQVQSQNGLLFLQNVQTTLKMLLENRLNTNKLFMLEDIQKLIESLTFTLALLQQKNIPYKDISPQHIFYDNGAFKLLPNQLIEQTTFQKLKIDSECLPSPQLLIGLKLAEEDIEDEDILQKCNVFTLGMVMLEVATLLPSCECYDLEGYQIYHEVLRERVVMVGQYYGQKVARIIANMVDYDFQERMTLKELSIWVNRQLQPDRNTQHPPDQLAHSMMISKVTQKHQHTFEPRQTYDHNNLHLQSQTKKLSKNNSVYMKRQPEHEQSQIQQRNKVYIADRNSHSPESPISNNRMYTQNSSYHQQMPSRNQYHHEKSKKQVEKMVYHHQGFNQTQKYGDQNKNEARQANPYCQEFKFPREARFQQQNLKKMSKEPVNPYRNFQPHQDSRQFQAPPRQKQPLKELNNKYYPKIEDILHHKAQGQMPMPSPKESLSDSNTISRIKEEILRSRQMLQEFRRSEGVK